MTAAMHLAVDRPSAWIERFAPLVPEGEVLDVACGGGRHARLLTALGHRVLAVDRDADALAKIAAVGIDTEQIDLEAGGERVGALFGENRYAGIVLTNYLHRPLFPLVFRALAPGGVLLYETFAQGNERFGKPSNPDFLLAPGELLAQVRSDVGGSWHVLAYEDGYVELPKPAMVQRICAVKNVSPGFAERLRLI